MMIEKDPLQTLWKSQTTTFPDPDIEQVKRGATTFQSTIRWRNVGEYAAALLVIVMFGRITIEAEHSMTKLGAVLIVFATGFVCYKMHSMAKAATSMQLDMAVSIIKFHRAELQRQRQALSSVWRWYLLPFLPGLLVYTLGNQFAGSTSESVFADALAAAVKLSATAVIFYIIYWLNQRQARKLEREIAELQNRQ